MELRALLGIEVSDTAGWPNAIEASQAVRVKPGDPFIDAVAADLEEEGNLSAGMTVLKMGESQQADALSGIGFCLG